MAGSARRVPGAVGWKSHRTDLTTGPSCPIKTALLRWQSRSDGMTKGARHGAERRRDGGA